MNVLVTGGSGLVGGAVCAGLQAHGHQVRSVDRELVAIAGVDSRVADIRVREAIYAYLSGIDAVIHLANHSNQWRADAQTILTENYAMNAHVFQAALEAGVRHVVFSSSVQAISGLPLGRGREAANRAANRAAPRPVYPISGDTVHKAGNAYGVSKIAGEQLLRYYGEVCGMATTALRLPFIVRERQGLERQALAMANDTWAHEGFAWLWVGDLGALMNRVLATSVAGYRCLLPSAPAMTGMEKLNEILAAMPEARVAPLPEEFLAGWTPTPLEGLPPG